MKLDEYLGMLPKKKLSEAKLKILRRLWGVEDEEFPKPWVSSAELLKLTGQKYFDRRARELRDHVGCDLETSYREEFPGHAWRIHSTALKAPLSRKYLSKSKKKELFEKYESRCATCGLLVSEGVRGLQADHKIPVSRGGGSELINWQPLCNNCNVGKRRACEACHENCNACSWAFPETVGIPTVFSIGEKTLRGIREYSLATDQTPDKVMEKAAIDYLEKKRPD